MNLLKAMALNFSARLKFFILTTPLLFTKNENIVVQILPLFNLFKESNNSILFQMSPKWIWSNVPYTMVQVVTINVKKRRTQYVVQMAVPTSIDVIYKQSTASKLRLESFIQSDLKVPFSAMTYTRRLKSNHNSYCLLHLNTRATLDMKNHKPSTTYHKLSIF